MWSSHTFNHQLWSDFRYLMRDQRNLIQTHFLGVLVLTDFLAEFMQAVDWGQQVIWACRLLARVCPGLRQEGGNKRMEQPSCAGGICPRAILLCGEAIHPNSLRTASYPPVMLGTPLGGTGLGSRELSRARSLCLTRHCWSQWTSVFAGLKQSPVATPAPSVGLLWWNCSLPHQNLLQMSWPPAVARNWETEGTNEEGRSADGARLIHVSTSRPKLGGKKGSPPAAQDSGDEEGSAGEEDRWGATTQTWSMCCLHMLLWKI